MEGVREARLEAHVLALLREEQTLDSLHASLKPRFPRLGKAALFALLVRLRREGRVAYRAGRFRLAGEAQGPDV